MNEQDTQRLIRMYPSLWKHLRGGYFECGDGWLPIIEEFSTLANGIAYATDLVIVKEKFGTLRIQGLHARHEGLREEFWRLINAAEGRSAVMCEVCGEPASRVGRGWRLATLCEEHLHEKHRSST